MGGVNGGVREECSAFGKVLAWLVRLWIGISCLLCRLRPRSLFQFGGESWWLPRYESFVYIRQSVNKPPAHAGNRSKDLEQFNQCLTCNDLGYSSLVGAGTCNAAAISHDSYFFIALRKSIVEY